MPEFPPEYAPDRGPSYKWSYSPGGYTEYVPVPPKPYATFDSSNEY